MIHQKWFCSQGERSSRPSTAGPSREISVQNLSNQGLGSPTKVGLKRFHSSQMEEEVPPLWKWTQALYLEQETLGCLSHSGQGQHGPWPIKVVPHKLAQLRRHWQKSSSNLVPTNFGGIPKKWRNFNDTSVPIFKKFSSFISILKYPRFKSNTSSHLVLRNFGEIPKKINTSFHRVVQFYA